MRRREEVLADAPGNNPHSCSCLGGTLVFACQFLGPECSFFTTPVEEEHRCVRKTLAVAFAPDSIKKTVGEAGVGGQRSGMKVEGSGGEVKDEGARWRWASSVSLHALCASIHDSFG